MLMLSTRQASADDRSYIFNTFCKNVNILEFHGHIWNHHEKCIQQSTNMPGIGLLIREIDIKMSETLGEKTLFSVKPIPSLYCVK